MTKAALPCEPYLHTLLSKSFLILKKQLRRLATPVLQSVDQQAAAKAAAAAIGARPASRRTQEALPQQVVPTLLLWHLSNSESHWHMDIATLPTLPCQPAAALI